MKEHRTSTKIKIVILSLAFVFLFAMSAFALDSIVSSITKNQDISIIKSTTVGKDVEFNLDEICQRLGVDKKNLSGIVVTDLPDFEQGTLMLDGREVLVFEKIPKAKISKLSFIPNGNYSGNVIFSLKPYDKNGYMDKNAQVTIKYSDTLNLKPTAESVSLNTLQEMPASGFFRASDPEEDTLKFIIVSAPKQGDVSLSQDTASYNYIPFLNAKGKDTFSYYTEDTMGNVSDVATVSVNIEKTANSVYYSDMQNHWAHYDAVKLYEAGVIKGEKIGSNYFFNPDKKVSKGDFLVMLMDAVGLEKASSVTTAVTTMANDSDIPAWMKSYVSSAVDLGIVTGTVSGSGSSAVFDASSPVTRAEAAVMTNRALKISDVKKLCKAYSDRDSIPSWALQSVINLEECGIVHGNDNNTFGPNTSLTRAQCAKILYSAKCYVDDAKKANRNVFQKVFGWLIG